MKPKHFLMRMFLFILAIGSAVTVIFPVLFQAFLANIVINSLILCCLCFGIFFIFFQVYLLGPEVQWLEAYKEDAPYPKNQPKLLAPLINVLKESTGTYNISTLVMRSLLDGVDARLDDSREISRFLPGLLVFLGLLGTFWGLIQTVGSIADVIANLNFSGQGIAEGGSMHFFDQLKQSLKGPLAGMGLAFSASMFGLAGSLILSFLDLQAGQAYRHFSRDLEEWLSTLTRLPISAIDGDKAHVGGAGYLMALMEQTNETINHLFRMFKETEDSRGVLNKNLTDFAEKIGKLTDQMRTEQNLMIKMAESQIQIQITLTRFSENVQHLAMDEITKKNLRNLDAAAEKILEEMTSGRKQVIDEVRNEIRLLSKTIANLAAE